MFYRKPYPILPTSESDTLTFMQKLDMLEYKVNEMNNKIYEIETSLATKSSVSATASGDVIQTITIDGETLDIPQGSEVSATGTGGTLETITVDGETFNVPQGGEAGETGTFTYGTTSSGQWRYVNDILVLQFVLANNSDGIDSTGAGIRFTDSDGNYWTKLDGRTVKGSISWVHDFGSDTYAAATANLQLAVFSDGLGNLNMPGGYCIPEGLTPFASNVTLQDIKGMPLMFLTVGLI